MPALPQMANDLTDWLQTRCDDVTVEWPYHPRSNQVSSVVRQGLVRDLMAQSPIFSGAVREGKVVAQRDVKLAGRRKQKTLDLMVGSPAHPQIFHDRSDVPEGEIDAPWFVLETKSCMTAHAKATSRLVDELTSSLDVVDEATPPGTACVGVVVVNFSQQFTSPLNLPGPNAHDAAQVADLIAKLQARIPVGADGYLGLAFVAIDFDNEYRAKVLADTGRIPAGRSYELLLASLNDLMINQLNK